MKAPERIVVEYADGTRAEAPFGALSSEARDELSKLGLCGPQETKGYLVIEWKDGWREVAAVDGDAVGLLRYYTIERTEEVGRLSFETTGQYPQLLLVKRLPAAVRHLLLLGGEGLKGYTLEEKTSAREGGKVERTYYDAKKPGSAAESRAVASGRLDDLAEPLEIVLAGKGISASEALSAGKEEREGLYRELAAASRLKGAERQGDLYGFIDLVLARIAAGG